MSAPRSADRSGERSSGARGRYRSTTLRAATRSATVGSRCTARRYFAAEMRTWGEERDAAVALLRAAGIATAALDADVLLAHGRGGPDRAPRRGPARADRRAGRPRRREPALPTGRHARAPCRRADVARIRATPRGDRG